MSGRIRVIIALLMAVLFADCTPKEKIRNTETMTTVRMAIAEICRTDNDSPTFVSDRSTLQPILDQLHGELPTDILEYLNHCIPRNSYGRMVAFHGYQTLIEENRDYVPGGDTIKQDLLCIAKAGDGSQFAYDVLSGAVFHIGLGASESPEKTRENADRSWNSLIDFLNWYLKELQEVVAEE